MGARRSILLIATHLNARIWSAGLVVLWLVLTSLGADAGPRPLTILNFYGSCGFEHESREAGLQMIKTICTIQNWKILTTKDPSVFNEGVLSKIDVVIFNNNCGNSGRIFKPAEQAAFQSFIRMGGGFLGIHCAGAIWKEEPDFQQWYEKLLGTRLIDHPAVQEADCRVEDRSHPSTAHLPELWKLKDEFHRMSPNPRAGVRVLISVDEQSYQGKEKMNGDHPVVWCHEFDGGRAFFSSLGHTKEIYSDPYFVKLITAAIKWCAQPDILKEQTIFPLEGLIVDLNADHGVMLDAKGKVERWVNQVSSFRVKSFEKNGDGRKDPQSGMPVLLRNIDLGGHNSIGFKKQELVAADEDAFDHLITGRGYTWFCVMRAGKQSGELKDVNSFFGTLRNGGFYEGIWAGLNDDNRPWTGSRNGKSFGRWDNNNPYVLAEKPLKEGEYYLLIGRMEKGTDTVAISLFVNDAAIPVAKRPFPVNVHANASKLVIGQERDAVEHPGKESFIGEISRFLLYERPLNDKELIKAARNIRNEYGIENK